MKKFFRPIGIAAVIAAGAFVLSGTAAAQPQTVAACSAEFNHAFGQGFNDAWVFSTPPSGKFTSVTQPLGAPIVAGTYDLSTVAWDGSGPNANPDRIAQGVQPFETYIIQFLDAGGNVLATSGETTDLEDLVLFAQWAGPIGQVTWAGADATQVRVVHAHIGEPNLQSVHARCVGWSPAQPPTTTTTTTTTTTSTTTTTTVIDDPSTTTTTTTTTSQPGPTEVLPEVEVAQPADPVGGDPTFTG